MPYIPEENRDQLMVCSLDSLVDPESDARLIDAFVESLDLSKFEIKADTAAEGRPRYNDRAMTKLLIYGYENDIRSSRKLQKACRINMEVRWLMKGLEPDFRTISDFRKNNIRSMKKIFREFNKRLSEVVHWGFTAIDGSKFQASNSKDNNFTKNKIDDRVKWLDEHAEEYLRLLAEADSEDEQEPGSLTREELEEKLQKARERLARYEGYQKLMEETGQAQLSLVDADAKLMKNKNGFAVAYNPQTAVDSETHIIRDYQMTNQVTDHNLIDSTMSEIKKESGDQVIDAVADKGYVCEEDVVRCLEQGIRPHVITDDGQDAYEIEIPYSDESGDPESTKAEELRKCIHNGVIPKAYADVITDMKVKEARRLVKDEEEKPEADRQYGTEDEMLARAKEGYFVRDPERNLVYCPAGEILRQKCVKKNGNIRYANKNACRHCKFRNKCYKGKNEWKEIDFSKDTLEKPCTDWLKAEGRTPDRKGVKKCKGHYEKIRVVKFKLKPDREKTSKRLCLSEHPFGTIKRAMGSGFFLLRRMWKVDGEFALLCLGYNLKRSKNLLGFAKMKELMALA